VPKEGEQFTCRFQHGLSKGKILGKIGYEVGVHLFEITWPKEHRGAFAGVGVSCGKESNFLNTIKVSNVTMLYCLQNKRNFYNHDSF